MKRYIILYTANAEAQAKMNSGSKEEQTEMMKNWFAWKDEAAEKLIDFGSPTMPGKSFSLKGESPTANNIVGYSLLKTEDEAAAIALVKKHPHIAWHDGCNIDLMEMHDIPESV